MKEMRVVYIGNEVIVVYYRRNTLFWTAFVTIMLGGGLHFLYHCMPCAVTALLSPVNESIWEHIKLVYWPYLLAALWLNRGRPGGMYPWLLCLPLMCGTVLVLGGLYHIVLGRNEVWVDLACYAAVMAAGFWIPPRFSGPFRSKWWFVPVAAVVLTGVLIGAFTLWPPEHILFADLSGAKVWLEMPC